MLDFKTEPFSGYVYYKQFGTIVPDTPVNKEFILSCNYAIRLLKEVDRNIDTLFAGMSKIIHEKPDISDEIYESCFWLSDKIIDLLIRLDSLFKRFMPRYIIDVFKYDSTFVGNVRKIRDNQTHLDEKLLIDMLTSYFRLTYFDIGLDIEMKLDNQMPYFFRNDGSEFSNTQFKPQNLTYKILDSRNRKEPFGSMGEIEVDFLSIKTCMESMCNFLKINMQSYVSEYNISCPAPSQLSIIVS